MFCEGSGVYFMITRYLHSLAECSCDDNTVECFLCSFYWLIPLFICSIIIPYTLTSLPRWIFWVRELGYREREREREKGKGGEKESLFSIFSLITNQYISLWRPDHSVGRRIGSFSPLFISLLFDTFPSLPRLPGISPGSKCQTNKPRNKIPRPPSPAPSQTDCMFSILIKITA